MSRGFVRIIAGKWRGRKLAVPEMEGLRPTPDRVRETLFNWLSPMMPGAHCLDLFAGSGALGFEALSRGAASVTMIDKSSSVINGLKEAAQLFSADNALIYQATVPDQLRAPPQPYDVVFMDPPFQAALWIPCCHYLEAHHFLAPTAYIYLEAEHIIKDNELPTNWQIIKSKQAGQVYYHLARRIENINNE